jgi:hypothetical protein
MWRKILMLKNSKTSRRRCASSNFRLGKVHPPFGLGIYSQRGLIASPYFFSLLSQIVPSVDLSLREDEEEDEDDLSWGEDDPIKALVIQRLNIGKA